MSHPFSVQMAYNRDMRRWDLAVIVGGFDSEEEVKDAAKQIADWLGENGWIAAVEPREH